MISPTDLTQRLRTDPNEGIEFILSNNQDGVVANLVAQGFQAPGGTTPQAQHDEIRDALRELLRNDQKELFVQALTVTMTNQGLTAGQLAAASMLNAEFRGRDYFKQGYVDYTVGRSVDQVTDGLASHILLLLIQKAEAGSTRVTPSATAAGVTSSKGTTDASSTGPSMPTPKQWRTALLWVAAGVAGLIILAIAIRVSKKS